VAYDNSRESDLRSLNERPREARNMVKLQPGSESESLSEIQKIYGRYNDHLPFEYRSQFYFCVDYFFAVQLFFVEELA